MYSQTAQANDQQHSPVSSIFDDVRQGISSGDIHSFSNHFAKQVFVDLPGVDGGYFSGSQLFYILQNFFGSRTVTSQFRFTTIDETETGPYGTGSCNFIFRGNNEHLQIYVALTMLDSRWVITQFNVY